MFELFIFEFFSELFNELLLKEKDPVKRTLYALYLRAIELEYARLTLLNKWLMKLHVHELGKRLKNAKNDSDFWKENGKEQLYAFIKYGCDKPLDQETEFCETELKRVDEELNTVRESIKNLEIFLKEDEITKI